MYLKANWNKWGLAVTVSVWTRAFSIIFHLAAFWCCCTWAVLQWDSYHSSPSKPQPKFLWAGSEVAILSIYIFFILYVWDTHSCSHYFLRRSSKTFYINIVWRTTVNPNSFKVISGMRIKEACITWNSKSVIGECILISLR